jgi:gamma-glutamylaminecyclotransferase
VTTRVFVYGSLLAGEPNHRALEGARFVGVAQTEPRYSLHDLGAYPALVADGTHAIVGELYDVDDEVLARLDRLEGHPEFYRRDHITLADGSDAETYFLPHAQAAGTPRVTHGDWRKRREEKRR